MPSMPMRCAAPLVLVLLAAAGAVSQEDPVYYGNPPKGKVCVSHQLSSNRHLREKLAHSKRVTRNAFE